MAVNVFDILVKEAALAADEALLSALRGSDRETSARVVETILRRGRREGVLGLIEQFHEFDDSIQRQILQSTGIVLQFLRNASSSPKEQTRVNLQQVLRQGTLFRGAYLAEAGLHDRSARVREAAGEALYALADALFDKAPPTPDAESLFDPQGVSTHVRTLAGYAEDRRHVLAALETGVTSFSLHHLPRVLEAAMWFPDRLGTQLFPVITQPGSRAAQTVAGIIREMNSPRLIPFCLYASNYKALRPHVAQALSRCRDDRFLEAWIGQSWRLKEYRIARGAQTMEWPERLRGHHERLLALSAAVPRALARWVRHSGESESVKLEFLKRLAQDAHAGVRRSALWQMIQIPSERVTAFLPALLDAEDRDLALMAHLELARRRPAEFPPRDLLQHGWDTLRTAPLPERAEPLDFESYWRDFDLGDEEEQRARWAMLAASRPSAEKELADRLASEDAGERLRALKLVAVCRLAEPFRDEVYRLCQDDDHGVRSAAITAAGQLPDSASRDLLTSALSDEDGRVQANAIEALEQAGGPGHVEDLRPKLTSPDNRVRANAVRVLLKLGVREAAETLLWMLKSDERGQRISALWLVEQMGLFTLTSRVMEMANVDQDGQVRERAGRLSQALGAMPAEPAGTSTPVEVGGGSA